MTALARRRRFLLALAFLLTVAACQTGTRLGPLEEQGRRIYESTCIACHGGVSGGSMMDYPPKHNASGHTWHHPDCELRTVIETGGGPMVEMMRRMMAPPNAPTMPPFRERLSAEEIDAVLAFIKTMWDERQRRFQEEVTREAC